MVGNDNLPESRASASTEEFPQFLEGHPASSGIAPGVSRGADTAMSKIIFQSDANPISSITRMTRDRTTVRTITVIQHGYMLEHPSIPNAARYGVRTISRKLIFSSFSSMALEQHHSEQEARPVEATAIKRVVPPGYDEFRAFEALASGANMIDPLTYRYRTGIQDCAAFKEPR